MRAFSGALEPGKSETEKIRILTETPNHVFLAADRLRMLKIFHSPINFGGTLLRPSHKVACLVGMGRSATSIKLDISSATADCNIVTPSVEDLAACLNADDVRALVIPNAVPAAGAFFSYVGSNTLIPAPWLRDAILAAESLSPLTLSRQ